MYTIGGGYFPMHYKRTQFRSYTPLWINTWLHDHGIPYFVSRWRWRLLSGPITQSGSWWIFQASASFSRWAVRPTQEISAVRIQHPTTRSQLKVFVKQQQHDAGQLTVADLRAMLAEGDQHIVNQMICYGANLRGTRTYWTARRHELMDFIQNKSNPPRLSLNLLSASYHMSSLRRRIGMCMMMFFWTRDDYWDHYMIYFPFLFTGINLSFGTLIFRFVSLD